MRKTYTAKLSNGATITRKTDSRSYSHAWAVMRDGEPVCKGWAASAELARKAANSECNGYNEHGARAGLNTATVEIVPASLAVLGG